MAGDSYIYWNGAYLLLYQTNRVQCGVWARGHRNQINSILYARKAVVSIIEEIKRLPRFEGSHCPNESDHEYIVRKDNGKYIRIEDVLKIISGRGIDKRD